MKKNLVVILSVVIIFILSSVIVYQYKHRCSGQESEMMLDIARSQTPPVAIRAFTVSPSNQPIVSKDQANINIHQYINNTNTLGLVWYNNSFIFKDASATLKFLCDYIDQSGASKVQFLLGADNTGHELLYIACLDKNGNHLYINGNSVFVANVCFATCNHGSVTAITTAMLGQYTNANSSLISPALDIPINSITDVLECSIAQGYIDNYCQSPGLPNIPYSFVYDAQELLNYINAAHAKGITALQFYSGVMDSDTYVLKTMIVGIDNVGNHIFLQDATNKQYLLDQCMPCPVCDIAVNNSQQDYDRPTAKSFIFE